MESREDRLNELLENLSPVQLRFVAVRPHCNSDAEAARRVGISQSTVYHWPEDERERLNEAVQLLTQDVVEEGRHRLRALISKAIDVIEEELESGLLGDSTRMRAALETLNRGGLTSEQRVDVTSGGEPIAHVTSEEQERTIKELQSLLKGEE